MFKKIARKSREILCCEREIICISNNKISSRKVGFVFVAWNILLVLWTAFTTVSYFELKKQKELREYEISTLKTERYNLLSTTKVLEKNIDNIQDFIFALNKYDRFSDIAVNLDQKIDENVDEIKLVLDRTKQKIGNVNLAISERISKIREIKNNLGVNSNIQLVSHEEIINDVSDLDFMDSDVLESIVLKKTSDGNVQSLAELESFLNIIPLSLPVNFGYVSSKYGERVHPITKTVKSHHGVDLVGAYMTKIFAPADGVVKFVGTKGGYGKTIIIEHGYNLTTVYGHLNSISVEAGDIVKRGDIIGVQGNTGRSTGDHLHYEVLQGKNRYNPLEFIEIGRTIY